MIRHNSDYGSILLVDERYPNYTDMISNWLKEQIMIPDTNADVLKNMEEFFRVMKSRGYQPKASHVADMVEQAEMSANESDNDD